MKKKPPASKFPLTCFTYCAQHSFSEIIFHNLTSFAASVAFSTFTNPFITLHLRLSPLLLSLVRCGLGKTHTQNCSKAQKILKFRDKFKMKKRSIFSQDYFGEFLPLLDVFGLLLSAKLQRVEGRTSPKLKRTAACHWGDE